MARVLLGLGANIGEIKKNLQTALDEISNLGTINSVSNFYKTEPVGYENQPWFLNQAVELDTMLPPVGLLRAIQEIEKKLGRKRVIRYGPRLIDIDILFYDDLILETEQLIIPHPHVAERKFVLMPLTEIAPQFIHPVLKKSLATLLGELTDDKIVEKIV